LSPKLQAASFKLHLTQASSQASSFKLPASSLTLFQALRFKLEASASLKLPASSCQ